MQLVTLYFLLFAIEPIQQGSVAFRLVHFKSTVKLLIRQFTGNLCRLMGCMLVLDEMKRRPADRLQSVSPQSGQIYVFVL